MPKQKNSETPEKLLRRLAASSPNDAVRLLFLGEEDISLVGGLDLSLLTEMKRSANGTVEIKLLNRLDIIRELHELEHSRDESLSGANFYAALDRAADTLALKSDGDEV